MQRVVAWVRTVPMTLAVAAITFIVFLVQLAWPPLLELLQRDGPAVLTGQWWRFLTSMLVHGGGWLHLLFNLLGIVLVGSAVERTRGPWRWLIIYTVAGVGAGVLQFVLFPDVADSGASGGLAGLIGALTLHLFRGRRAPIAAMIFAAFFTSYLAALVWFGLIAGPIAGTLIAAILGITVRWVDRGRFGLAVAIVVALGTLALLLAWDVHGQGVVLGFALAYVIGKRLEPTRSSGSP
jgi:membrane associated rhomboid family serine protease